MKDARLYQQAYDSVEHARQAIENLYARWAELEEKTTRSQKT
jgi:hypothetical protein